MADIKRARLLRLMQVLQYETDVFAVLRNERPFALITPDEHRRHHQKRITQAA